MSRLSLMVLAALSSAILAGCGEGPPELVDVEGTILLKGKPLEKVRVEFWPLNNGPQSSALTDDQGRFVLMASEGAEKGAILGKHKVVLRDVSIFKGEFMGRAGADVDMTKGEKPRIASKYTNVMKTTLETEITGEQRDLKFEVEPFTR
jgi:hypothetical protein